MNIDDIRVIIDSIDWSEYETAYGNADQDIPHYTNSGNKHNYTPKVSQSLLDLFSEDKETAMQATHDLWCGLCHQHAFVSSASLPAYDILFYALQCLDDDMKVELLDIFCGFAVCISKENSPGSWQGQLRSKLERDKAYFQTLTGHSNEDISGFSESIVEEL